MEVGGDAFAAGLVVVPEDGATRAEEGENGLGIGADLLVAVAAVDEGEVEVLEVLSVVDVGGVSDDLRDSVGGGVFPITVAYLFVFFVDEFAVAGGEVFSSRALIGGVDVDGEESGLGWQVEGDLEGGCAAEGSDFERGFGFEHLECGAEVECFVAPGALAGEGAGGVADLWENVED